ncbi:MAG: alpha/beta hydrolase family protein [Armatimonadota bacterium]
MTAALEWFQQHLGLSPTPPASLNPQLLSTEDAGDHQRTKVVLLPDDPDPLFAYLLVPKHVVQPAPAVLCLHSTTEGSGKDVPAGVAGFAPGSQPVESRAYALQLVRRGYVALVPDMLCDGERVVPGDRPYDTRAFYHRFPAWSAAGKVIWDNQRVLDYLCTLDIVDPGRIGVVGHSHGAHYGLFTALFDDRIKAVVCNGGVLYWSGVGDPCHWARTAPTMVHMPALHSYYEQGAFPHAFWECLAAIAPRRLLCMDGEADGNHYQVRETFQALRRVYASLGCEANLAWFSYPGGHDFPKAARQHAYAWLEENLKSVSLNEGSISPAIGRCEKIGGV